MQGLEQAKVAEKGLKSAAGFIRRELGHRLKLRHVPQLILPPQIRLKMVRAFLN